MISLIAYGLPQPGGSKGAFALRRKDGSIVTRPGGAPIINVVDANPKAKEWKQAVAWAARAAYKGQLLSGPLVVSMAFYRPRPKSHWKADRSKGMTKTGGESIAPTSKPDVLKLARAAEDALTGVLWVDDAQIVTELIEKYWGEPARVEIRVSEVKKGAPARLLGVLQDDVTKIMDVA